MKKKLVKRKVVELNLILEGSCAYDEFHRAIDEALDKSYKRKGPIYESDRKQAVKNVMEVLKKCSRRKRGPRFNSDITSAIVIFRKELKKAGLTFGKFNSRTPKERQKFWNERIWATRRSEIISHDDLVKLTIDGHERLMEEQKRIQDRVRREMIKRKGKGRIDYRTK